MRLINTDLQGVYTGDNVDGMVREYMKAIADPDDGLPYVPNTTLFRRQVVPNFPDRNAERAFWEEQIRKWRFGDGDMPGMHHTYFHHSWMRVRAGGRTRPDFRRHDMVTFDLMEAMAWGQSRWFGDMRGKGAIELGKRGSGKSNRIGMCQLTMASLQDAVDIGFTANSENTVKKFLDDKPRFIWSNLPPQLRATAERNNLLQMGFYETTKDAAGNTLFQGRNSNIICRSPVPEAFESLGLKATFIDEAPKTKQLRLIFDMTDPCMASPDGFEREGFWWITGVAGDFDKHGDDFIEMWETADALDLVRVFIPGWSGMEVDEYGNEDVERAVRKILLQRSKYKPGSEELFRRIQQYPLTPEECFLEAKEAKMPTTAIRHALQRRYSEPVQYRVCSLDLSTEQPRLVDDQQGKIKMLEAPMEGCSYTIGVDTFGYKMKFAAGNMPGKDGEGSSGGLVIHKAPVEMAEAQRASIIESIESGDLSPEEELQMRLSIGGLPVLHYLDKPQNPDLFAMKCAAIIRIYGWRALVERIPSNVLEYFINNGMREFLFWEPWKKEKARMSKSDYARLGIKLDEYWAAVRLQLLYSYYERWSESVYFEEMLQNALLYNPDVQRKKFDNIDAHGISLIQLRDPRFTWVNGRPRSAASERRGRVLPFSTRRA